MQHLEFSGAVRLIYESLGFKGLTEGNRRVKWKFANYAQFLVSAINHEHPNYHVKHLYTPHT